MSGSIGIVDLFAGPGGLGEGFSRFRVKEGVHPYSIEVSIEKDPAPHATLQLRSFLRKFGESPEEYHEFLNGKLSEPDWPVLYPEEWRAAEAEARCMELGTGPCTRFLNSRIPKIRDAYTGRTVLIGGPPCQAYSLAGRSRNAGNPRYVPQDDERNFLYKKYVDVLKMLEPAAFVMENVKGMLSSAIKEKRIFHKVMKDLMSATGPDSYRLLALYPGNEGQLTGRSLEPEDFVVRMEDHGVPQARHRVIIIGIRQDIANDLKSEFLHLPLHDRQIRVKDVIGTMPPIRSGLRRNDDWLTWQETVLDAVRLISRNTSCVPNEFRDSFRTILSRCRNTIRTGTALERTSSFGTGISKFCPEELREWIQDPHLRRLPNHETRSHMQGDLVRYLYAAAFGHATGHSPKAEEFPSALAPNHKNWNSGKFSDRFRVQIAKRPASTITCHISKDGHYYIHPKPNQCRSLTVREAARLQTFPDNYLFKGTRTQQYVQVGNAVPPYLAWQIAGCLWNILGSTKGHKVIVKKASKSSSNGSR